MERYPVERGEKMVDLVSMLEKHISGNFGMFLFSTKNYDYIFVAGVECEP